MAIIRYTKQYKYCRLCKISIQVFNPGGNFTFLMMQCNINYLISHFRKKKEKKKEKKKKGKKTLKTFQRISFQSKS